MLTVLAALLLLSAAGSAARIETRALSQMQNLVTFGDSYTDESRKAYFAAHGGSPPPAGQPLPASDKTSTGGYTWGRYVANSTGARYYNYAVGGAMCDNNITNHWFPNINANYPAVLEYEIPAFKADVSYQSLYPDRQANNTVYAVWIGTNDLGIDGFLSDKNVAGTQISNFVECVWKAFDGVYQTGGRNFVLLNTAPLHFSPLYASPSISGALDNGYWANKTKYNMTEYQYKMFEYTTSVNTLFAYGAPFNLVVKKRWPGASFTVFDVHSLMLEIRANPSHYLTAPANVTSSYSQCGGSKCAHHLSSFLWNDELHPSTKTEEVIANEFIQVVQRQSKYATYYTSV